MSLIEDIKKEEAGMSLLEELANTPEEAREYTESEKWMPTEPGESIEGVVLETFSFEGKFVDAKTGDYPEIPGIVLQVDGDDTPWSVVGLHGVLRQEIDKASPQPGDRVAVIYSGPRKSKGGNDYEHYRMAIRRGGGSVKPVPASKNTSASNGSTKSEARGGSTQHEPVAKDAAPKRKPGQPKNAATPPPADTDDPDF